MGYRSLGNIGLKVPVLRLGAMTFGEADDKSFMHEVGCLDTRTTSSRASKRAGEQGWATGILDGRRLLPIPLTMVSDNTTASDPSYREDAHPLPEPEPTKVGKLAAVLVPAVAGLIASAILLVDYIRPLPVFCTEGGGCDVIKHTTYANALGLPTPLLGVAGFFLLGNLALTRGRGARAIQLGVSVIGALVALFLLGVQVKVGAFCKYCFVADVSMILIAAASVYRFVSKWDLGDRRRMLIHGLSELVLAGSIIAPVVIGMNLTLPVPQQIAEEIGKTPKGEVTVVDFVDFECPFCRMSHGEWSSVMAKHKAQLRIVRKQVPLTRIHPHAMTAALAACCAEQLGQGDAMAEALFATPAEELTPEKCEELAQKLGLPLDAFRHCVSDPKTEARIKDDTAMFKATGGLGLPTVWVGNTKLEGAQPEESIEQAVDQALARAGS